MGRRPTRARLLLALRGLLFAGLVAAAACEDEQLIAGRCDDSNDCPADQRCEQMGRNFHRCISVDGSADDAGRGLDRPVGDLTADVDVASGDTGNQVDVPQDLAPMACTTMGDCKDPLRPFCQAGTCVGCQSPDAGSCSAPRLLCDPGTGACVECLTNAQCPSAALPFCVARLCAPCSSGGGDSACKLRDPAKPVCAISGRCAECSSNDQCKASPDKGFCVTETCVGCQQAGAAACSGATPVCNAASGTCMGCMVDADCKQDAAPFCLAGKCVGCAMVAAGKCAGLKPTKPACGASGACTECVSTLDCTLDPTRPICNTVSSTCRPCKADSECAARGPNDPGICLDQKNGACATLPEVIVVSNTPGCGTTVGSKDMPLCLAQDAAALFAESRSVVALHGTLDGLAWTLTPTTPALTVVGKDTAVIAGGIKSGIRLEGPGDVLVRGVTVRGSDTVGVVATGGATLRLRDTTIESNHGGGILLDGAHFDLRNTTVSDNGPGLTGATSWGGILAVAITGVPARLDNVSIKNNKQVGLACASGIMGSAIYAKGNLGGIDVQDTCAITTCDPESASCGAVPK